MIFWLENICLTVPKNFVEEPFCASENLWYRKILGNREGAGITIFRHNCFVSQYRKTSWGNPSVFQKISGIENFQRVSEGYVTIFRRKFFVSQYRNIS